MSKITSYLVHLSPAYKIVMTLIPIVLLLLQVQALLVLEFDILPFTLAVIVFADVFSDYFTFGGIYSKDAIVQSFYKISPRGKNIYLNVFLIHGLRRILLYFGYVLVSTILVLLLNKGETLLLMAGGTWTGYLISVLVEVFGVYAYSVVACFICRKLDMVMVSFAIAVWGTTFMMILNLIRMWTPVHVKITLLIIMIIISLAATVFLLWYNRKKMEDSYYDEKSFKRNQSGI